MGQSRSGKNVGFMIRDFVLETLAEDVGRGDLYARVLPSTPQKGYLIAKSHGVLAGVVYADILAQVEPFSLSWLKSDGERFSKGELLATFSGESHTLLKIERTLLNILHHASGIATLTRTYVDILAPYNVMLLDTRKTRPKLRIFEKYASRIGGAINHRMGLDDALMLKDTHLKTIADLAEYIKEARKKIPFTTTIEVEAESLAVAKEAMEANADIIMCDNMSAQEAAEVVRYRDTNHPRVKIEASGNISLETIELYAKSGVDAISTGSTIHQAVWPDISMKIE